MKKFLAYLLVIVVTVSLGFAVFYLVNDNEVISLSTTSLYKDAGSTFELSLDMKKNNSYTTIEVMSSDEEVIEITDKDINVGKGVAKATFVAKAGGVARVNFRTNNSKFRNLYCDITIGDGSKENPYYISTPAQLNQIGKTLEEGENPYTLNSCYEIVANLDMSEVGENWTPIGNEANPFTGTINGNGYAIYNLNISNSPSNNLGLISNIGLGGSVSNIKFDNVKIVAGAATQNIGCVAGVNNGSIERIEVKNLVVENSYENVNIGGIAGQNLSQINTVSTVNARISRCSANIDVYGAKGEGDTKTNVKGFVGGITAKNIGGTIINCYTKGNVKAGENVVAYGGIVGQNKYLLNTGLASQYSGNIGARVKDCYTIVNCEVSQYDPSQNIGALIGIDEDLDNVNSLVGLFYLDTCVTSEFFGIGQTASDEALVITRLTADKMKDLSNYLSYVEKVPYVEAGEVKYKNGNNVYWDSQIWNVVNNENDGYPILNYSAMQVNDNFPGEEGEILVGTAEQLNHQLLNNLDGSFVIDRDYDFSDYEWIPVGTYEKPFQGSLVSAYNEAEGRYFKIVGLRTAQSVENNHAGMFGAIGENAIVKNVVLEDVAISHESYAVAGAITAYNSWKNGNGGTIENCVVRNGVVSAKTMVGGIAGYNGGNIQECLVVGTNYMAEDLVVREASMLISVTSTEKSWVGGIAGVNNSTINGGNNYSKVSGLITIKAADNAKQVMIGGIAGENDGDIKYAKVEINTNYNNVNYGIITANNTQSYTGGIAGYSTAVVDNVSVSARIAVSSSDNTYVGGVVGYVHANNESSNVYNISNAYVYNSNIYGGRVGGIAGYVTTESVQSYSINDNYIEKWYAEKLSVNKSTYNTNLKITIFACAIEENVVLSGLQTGGFASDINRGVVYNCYTKAQLSGSRNAGFVYNILFNNSNKSGGLISRSYAIVDIKSGNNNHYVSASNVHAESNMSKRAAGFIDEYYYAVKSGHNGSAPTYNAGVIISFGNWFTSDENTFTNREREISTLQKDSVWSSFAANDPVTGSASVWTVVNGSLPSLPSAEKNK